MIEATDVLNPLLFNALRQFGPVRVVNHGMIMNCYYERQVGVDDRVANWTLKIVDRGETYVTDCPMCMETRSRLAVNYRCGEYDPDVKIHRYDGTTYNWHSWELWKCYNEECQSDPGKRKDFRQRVEQVLRDGHKFKLNEPFAVRVAANKRSKPILEECEFPGLLVPLHELPDDHPVILYLRHKRKFDTVALSRYWRVAYAAHVPARIRGSMSQGRIIVPVMRDGAMVGWQARYPEDLNWKAAGVQKYLTYFPKSLTIYGIDESEGSDVVALMEGVTDVWRYGPGAVCGLGKGLSPVQVELLAARLKDRPLVLVPDQDDPESEVQFFNAATNLRLRGYRGPVGLVTVPPGKDPADMDGKFLRRIVREAVAKAVQA